MCGPAHSSTLCLHTTVHLLINFKQFWLKKIRVQVEEWIQKHRLTSMCSTIKRKPLTVWWSCLFNLYFAYCLHFLALCISPFLFYSQFFFYSPLSLLLSPFHFSLFCLPALSGMFLVSHIISISLITSYGS